LLKARAWADWASANPSISRPKGAAPSPMSYYTRCSQRGRLPETRHAAARRDREGDEEKLKNPSLKQP